MSADRNIDNMFCYTSGRWLYNESRRLEERYLKFNIDALCEAAAASVSRHKDEIRSITKLAEGGFNRVFELTMQDGFQLVARLPYPFTMPKRLATASEVATMDLVRKHGIPTPVVYSYSLDANNSVGSEYIIMEKVSGQCLGDVWSELSDSERARVLGDIVEQEAKLFDIALPAYGSIFYGSDLPSHVDRAMAERQERGFCIGPDVSMKHWYAARGQLASQGGQSRTPLQLLEGVAKKETAWLRTHGKPRLPFEREYREMFDYRKVDHTKHLRTLDNYLKVAAYLVPAERWLHRPILRHPDLNPNNIFVDNDCKITSIIDWQHSSVLPLFLNAGIPAFFQNYGDPASEELEVPRLSANLEELEEEDRQKDIELYRRRHAHFYYVAATSTKLDTHWKAMTHDQGLLRKKVYQNAAAPWEGNSIPLEASLVQLVRNWPAYGATDTEHPTLYNEEEAEDIMRKMSQQEDLDRQMEILRGDLGINADGWMPCERYEHAVALAAVLKNAALNAADDDQERDDTKEHWVFDDFNEDE